MASSDHSMRCPRCGHDLSSPGAPCPTCAGERKTGPALPQHIAEAGLPRVTILLIAINVLVFVAMLTRGVPLLKPTPNQLLQWGANYGPLTLGGQWWRLLSSMFLHIGLVHLGVNMWCFFEMGFLAERLYRRGTYIAIYLLAGVAGSLASLARNPTIISAGASGAIFGVAGALITTLFFGKLPVPRSAIKETLRSLLLFAAFNLGYGFYEKTVDNGAHLGGLGCGLVLGALLSHDAFPEARRSWRTVVVPVFAAGLVASAMALYRADLSLVYLNKAQASLAARDTDGALRDLQALLARKPDYAPAYAMMGDIYLMRQQLPQAEQAYSKVMQLTPNNAVVQTQLGALYLRSGQLETARQALLQAAQMNPRNPLAYLDLGLTLQQMGKPEEAIGAYQKAVALQSNLVVAQFAIGQLSMGMKRYDDAIAAFQQTANLRPNDPSVLIWLANAYQAKGMNQQAQETFARAYQLRQKSAPQRPAR